MSSRKKFNFTVKLDSLTCAHVQESLKSVKIFKMYFILLLLQNWNVSFIITWIPECPDKYENWLKIFISVLSKQFFSAPPPLPNTIHVLVVLSPGPIYKRIYFFLLRKELSFCYKLWFSTPYIFATWYRRPLPFQTLLNLLDFSTILVLS